VAALSVSGEGDAPGPLLDRLAYLFTTGERRPPSSARTPTRASTTALASELSRTPHPGRGHRRRRTDHRARAARRAPTCRSDRFSAVNGAGDSFAAGTIAAITEGRSLNDSIRFGLAAAALTIEHGSVAAAPFKAGALAERIAAGPSSKSP
jgi:hypothetical protein